MYSELELAIVVDLHALIGILGRARLCVRVSDFNFLQKQEQDFRFMLT